MVLDDIMIAFVMDPQALDTKAWIKLCVEAEPALVPLARPTYADHVGIDPEIANQKKIERFILNQWEFDAVAISRIVKMYKERVKE